MGIFGKDRSTIIKGAVDLVGNVRGMIDDKHFTAEEKSRVEMQLSDATAKFVKDTLGESTSRSIARRNIAIVSIYFFYGLILLLITLWKFDKEWFVAVKDLIVEFQLPVAFIMIMAFFFGGYYLNKYIDKGEDKDKKNGK